MVFSHANLLDQSKYLSHISCEDIRTQISELLLSRLVKGDNKRDRTTSGPI